MQQVRIFKTVESEVANLQEEVNAWIKESGVNVISITGNIAPQSPGLESKGGGLGKGAFAASDVLLVVLYETA